MPLVGGHVTVAPRLGANADTLQRMSRLVTRTAYRAHRTIRGSQAGAWARRALAALACVAGLWSALAWGWDKDRLSESAAKLSPRTQASVRAMIQMADRAAAMPDERDRLTAVNNFFNQRVAFRDDIDVWGQIDYWATPLELLDKGAGDCEDYAIAKYFSLRRMGIPSEKLRITYVKALRQNRAHMVLTYYSSPQAQPLVLDSLMDAIKPASQRTDLLPVYAFNGEGLWLTGAAGNKKVGDTKRLSRWQDLLKKMQAEGFPAEPVY